MRILLFCRHRHHGTLRSWWLDTYVCTVLHKAREVQKVLKGMREWLWLALSIFGWDGVAKDAVRE